MAYKKQEIIDLCIKVINEKNVIFIEELVAYIPISKALFYNWKLHELDIVKDAIEQSKINKKAEMRDKWQYSDNATLQLANYKLMSTDREHDLLTMNRSDITTKGDKIEGSKSVLVTLDDAKKVLAELDDEI